MTNQEAIEHLENIIDRYPCSLVTFQDDCEIIAINLAIKALEGKHGKWIFDGVYHDSNNPIGSDMYHCSICKRSIITTLTKPTVLFPFCHCGADMQEEGNS